MNRRSPFGLQISRLRTQLRVELLEGRVVPSSTVSLSHFDDVQATVVQGEDTWFSLNNSGTSRLDANTSESPFAGVGSILVTTATSSFIGSAAAIGPRHVLTAAHVVDLNNDGKVNQHDRATGTYFILNFGEDQSHRIAIEKFDLHPDFTGFNRPAVNDDLAILTLAEDLPEGVPIYPIADFDLIAGSTVTIVGYGQSGDGIKGYDTSASLTVKRVGANVVDAFYVQDERKLPPIQEVFRFDFDSSKGFGPLGGPGIYHETQLGLGDSGGPSFMSTGKGLTIVGVNTFIQGANAPKFGSMGGGMNVFAYREFINSIINSDAPIDESGGIWIKPVLIPSLTSPLPQVPPPELRNAGIKLQQVLPLGPNTGTKPQKGIRIAAKAMSAEFAISSRNLAISNAGEASLVGADSFQPPLNTDAKLTSIPSWIFTPVRSLVADSHDLNLFRVRHGVSDGNTAVSLDSGLLAFATGEALSLE